MAKKTKEDMFDKSIPDSGEFDVAIIGAGAGGTAAAISAKEKYKDVCIIEATEKIGAKLLAAGNGRCNLTNVDMQAWAYNDPIVINTILRNTYLVRFFSKLGIALKNEDYRIYPFTNSSASYVGLIMSKIIGDKIRVFLKHKVIEIEYIDKFIIKTNEGTIKAKKLIFSTGSNATMGIESLDLLRPLGHTSTPRVPALTWLNCDKEKIKGLDGMRVIGRATLVSDGKVLAQDKGEIQFKESAVSGIPIFNISRYYARLENKTNVKVKIDFLNNVDIFKIYEETAHVHYSLYSNLIGYIPPKLAEFISEKTNSLNEADELLRNFTLDITSSGESKFAQIMTGGVPMSELQKYNFKSKKQKDLAIIGEALDIDGKCGGYNIHWALISGILAGSFI